MDDTISDLREGALAAHANAHCPYSRYAVGAAIRSRSGSIYTGCNVENAAYPEGICAETAAIGAMVLAGEREIAEVLVVSSGEVPGTPCGGCRQRLREFADPDVVVHSTTVGGATTTSTVAALLPDSFGPERLTFGQD